MKHEVKRNIIGEMNTSEKKLLVGDVISFGHYYPDLIGQSRIASLFFHLINGKRLQDHPIEWKVLEVRDGKALLISRYGFWVKKLEKYWMYHPWKESFHRKWLQEDFLKKAFSPEEQSKILPFNTLEDGTEDKITLLSISEVEHYFKRKKNRICSLDPHSNKILPFGCWWYLRSPASFHRSPAYVTCLGDIGREGAGPLLTPICLRPALWLDMNPECP